MLANGFLPKRENAVELPSDEWVNGLTDGPKRKGIFHLVFNACPSGELMETMRVNPSPVWTFDLLIHK